MRTPPIDEHVNYFDILLPIYHAHSCVAHVCCNRGWSIGWNDHFQNIPLKCKTNEWINHQLIIDNSVVVLFSVVPMLRLSFLSLLPFGERFVFSLHVLSSKFVFYYSHKIYLDGVFRAHWIIYLLIYWWRRIVDHTIDLTVITDHIIM